MKHLQHAELLVSVSLSFRPSPTPTHPLSPLFSTFIPLLFQQVRTLFAHPSPDARRSSALRVTDACWNFFPPSSISVLSRWGWRSAGAASARVRAGRDGVRCTRTGERDSSRRQSRNYRAELRRKPPQLDPAIIYIYFLSSPPHRHPPSPSPQDRTDERVSDGQAAPPSRRRVENRARFTQKVCCQIILERACPLTSSLKLVRKIIFFYPSTSHKVTSEQERSRRTSSPSGQKPNLLCLDLNRTIGWMGDLPETQTIICLRSLHGNVFSSSELRLWCPGSPLTDARRRTVLESSWR